MTLWIFVLPICHGCYYSKADLGARVELILPWERRWGACGPRGTVRQSWCLSPHAPSSRVWVGRMRKRGG